MPVWRTLGKAKLLVKAKTLPKTLFFSGLTIAALVSLLIPWEFRLKTTGTLEPVQRAEVFVAVNGQVDELLVKHGDHVQKGQLLLQLESPDLAARRIQIDGQIASSGAQIESLYTAIRRTKSESDSRPGQVDSAVGDLQAQMRQAQTDKASYHEQLQTLRQQEAMLQIHSPIAGEIVTWDLQRILPRGRPLMAGQRTMTIADTSPDAPWELITFLPEDDLGHFLRHHVDGDRHAIGHDLTDRNIEVTYVLLSEPGRRLHGRVVEVRRSAELIEEEGICYRVRVQINIDDQGQPRKDHEEPRPGAEVIARIHCGKRLLGFVLFHDVWEWVQTNLLF